MVEKTVDDVVEKWGRRLKGAIQDIKAGVDRVTEAPSAKAVEKKEKMLARLLEAIEDGTWENRLLAYGLSQWKKDMKETGTKRISSGVDKAEVKMKKFVSWLLTRVSEGQAKIKDLPDLTLEDNITRMTEFVRHMAEKKYKKES